MNSNEEENEREKKYFDLINFIDENYPIIAVMGVFGAISIYLRQISENLPAESQIINTGIFSSLFLFVLMSLLLNKEIIAEFISFSSGPFDIFTLVGKEAIMLTLFAIPFNILIISVSITALNFESSGSDIIVVVLLLLGFAVGSELILYIIFDLIFEHTSDDIQEIVVMNMPLFISIITLLIIYFEMYRIGININLLAAISEDSSFLYPLSFIYGVTASQIFVLLEIIALIYVFYFDGE